MEHLISIPSDISAINESDIIDMSKLKFDIDINQHKRYSFIYLRNTGLKNKLSFDNCSYEDKEEYLKLFLSANINVDIELLASTWINILVYNSNIDDKDEIHFESILNSDEIKLFSKMNIDYINKVRRLINSLSLYAVIKFNEQNHICSMGDIEYSDDTEIKIVNLYQLAKYPIFSLLSEICPPPERSLVYYRKTFDDFDNKYNMSRLTRYIPMFEMLSIMTASSDVQQEMLNNLMNESLDIKEE